MATPFLKWAGGKARLVPTVAQAIAGFQPHHYLEPFLGGGAMYFGLQARGLMSAATLNDYNPALIEAYQLLRDEPTALIGELQHLATHYLEGPHESRADFYYRVRAESPETPLSRAARLLFLNRTCFNGLYRVNRRGQFNVPHGRYAKPRICDPELLLACSEALAATQLHARDFIEICNMAAPGDLVYLDPPYQPLSATSSFTAYTDSSFGMADQLRLAHAVRDLTARGVYVALSNSTHPMLEDLYRDFHIHRVKMPRAINSVGSRRAPIDELLITNFEWEPAVESGPARPLTSVA